MQKLAEICIRRPVFATMLVMALVVMGLASYARLGVDFFPKVEFPIITITTTLRGAAPEEVETQVSKRIEEAVNTISGIDDLRSISAEGVSQVIVQFVLEKDAEVASQEVRDKVNRILSELPDDADPPLIEKLATDASPIINIVVASGRDLRETTKIVDDRIKKNIESLTGVGQVRFVGDRTRQIQVWLDGQKLYSYNLNVEQVRAALAAQNVEVPGGRVDQGARELTLRTLGRVERPQDFERIIVGNVGGAPVRISDIGHVVDGFEEPRSLAVLDGTEAVVLEVRKQAGTNTLSVISSIKERIAEIQKTLPPDYKITYTRDQSDFIADSFHAVQEHLILGGICAAIIVFLFLRNWRSTLIAAVAIPTSIISTYTLMAWMGFTLDQITMLALVLMVGIVIDDAIVVLENVFRYAEEKGMSPMQAAIEGTRDIGLAVLATTLSLVVIFLPVALMSGIVGRFMSSFGYTAAFAIMVSMLVSFTLTPMLCARFLKVKPQGIAVPAPDFEAPRDPHHKPEEKGLYGRILRGYRGMLSWSMGHRWAVALFSLLVVLSSVPLFMLIGKDFLPTDDQSEFEITVRMPPGSSLEGSREVMTRLENEVKTLPGIKSMLTTLGADTRKQVDRGSILVSLVKPEAREFTQLELMNQARERVQKFRDLTIAVQLPALIQGGGSNAELQFFLQGPDLAVLEKYAAQIREKLAAVPGVTDLESSYEAGKPELRVKVNRDKAADLNVNVASIANALRTLVGGDEQVTTFRDGDDRYDVQLRVDKQFRDSPAALSQLYVPSTTLGNVPVSSVASLEPATGPTQIERYNRQRQILLTANLTNGQSLSNVLTILDKSVEELKLPIGYSTGLVGRSKEFGRAAASYVIAFVLSIVFMYMILAAQFESFIDPITILLSLPLSVPFALLSLLIVGENFSIIYTSVGILVLFGIVKKNSILQIDHIKTLRREGMDRLEAIMRGCEDRLRPILMTTAALVAGMIPLALGGGAGSGSRRTVAIVVIGGQTLCLLLTLLVTPVAYSLFDDVAHATLWARMRAFFAARSLQFRRAFASMLPLLMVALLVGSMMPAAIAQDAQAQAPTQAEASQAGAEATAAAVKRTYPEVTAPARIGIGMTRRPITLKEAVELALSHNNDLEIQRTERDTAQQGVQAARGFFDPVFRYTPLFQNLDTPTSSVLAGQNGTLNERSFANTLSFQQRIPNSGFRFNVDFDNTRLSTNNPFVGLNPYLTSRLVLGFTQPLLRGFRTDRERTEIAVRGKQANLSEIDLEIRTIDVIGRIEQAYWDLVGAREAADVNRDFAALGREQLAVNQRLINAGTLAPVELSASEAEFQRRLDTWYQSLARVTELENNLKILITPDRNDPIWNDELIPTELNTRAVPPAEDIRETVDSAVRRRPEVRAVGVRRESNDLEKALAKDNQKPQVNLVGQYFLNGLGGTIRTGDNPFSSSNAALYARLNELSLRAGLTPVQGQDFGQIPGGLVGGLGTSLGNLVNYTGFQAGVQIDWNPRNRAADSNYTQTLIAEKRLNYERARTEQIIAAEVRNALQNIETARQRIQAAQASVRAAEDKLQSETRLFQTGESTNFLVLTRQNEANESRQRLVEARQAFNKSVSRLDQALGSTLQTYQVTVR
jgi:hydrophobic/amphiphilic exporter-1 (mainly G- bacteria), HAE1 family